MNVKSLVFVLVLVGCDAEQPLTQKPQSLEFVCETNGKLTERHVGVKHVYRMSYTMGWEIEYVDGDGQPRYYAQREGETCAVEVASP